MTVGYKKYLHKIHVNKILIVLCQIFIIVAFIFLWEYLARRELINTFIYSSPSRVISTIVNLYKNDMLFSNIWVTVYETLISFVLGTIIGIVIAIILWYSKFLYKVIDPFLTIINSLPKVSLGPIIIIIFGANINSIIIMALFISVIITTINVYNGFNDTSKSKINLLKSFNASKSQIFRYLVLPSSYSTIVSSLKINVSMSMIGLLPPVGEKTFFNKCYSRY